MRRVIFALLLLVPGKAWGCVGEDCWPYDLALTGYVIDETPLVTQPGCDPLTLEMSRWVSSQEGVWYGGYLLGGFMDPTWTVNLTRDVVAGVAPEDDSQATFSSDFWITRPEGSAIIGWAELKPTTNNIGFIIDDCTYSLKNTPYSIAGIQVMGDSNLDGTFDSGDLVEVFIAGKYETPQDAGWKDGDWSIDRHFDSNDFVVALTHGSYDNGVASAVPEPSAAVLLLALLPLQHRLRRRTHAAVKHVV